MKIHEDDGYEIEEELGNRLEQCMERLDELADILKENETTEHCYEETKKKIGAALKLMDDFNDSPEKAGKEINAILEDVEQYLKLGVLSELASMTEKQHQKLKKIEEKVREAREKKDDGKKDRWFHILHLSDLHFGIYKEKDDDNKRSRDFFRAAEEHLFPFLKKYIEENQKINVVAITGDVSFCKNEQGYRDFKEWLQKLCSEELLDIDIKDHVVMCPGNHDSEYGDRKTQGLIPKNYKQGSVGGILTIEKIRDRQDQFSHFNEVCRQLGIEPLKNFKTSRAKRDIPYVMGIKEIEGIYFVMLNSAWNSFPRSTGNGSDYGQLLLGRELIESLFEDTQIPENAMTVMLFHHPLAWLHEEESRTYGKDQTAPSSALIRQHADIVLNGHIHGGIEPPDILGNKTVVFTGGTLYTEDSCLNQFEIISVNMTKHYCQQKIVCYNRQGEPRGWERADEKYPTRIYYGIYRDMQDLAARYSLGEITKPEAEREASLRSATVGLQIFEELEKRMRYHQLSEMELDEDILQQKTASNTLEETAGQTKTMTKESGAGEKQS